jgi:S-adenosylmethionine:tRNA ribosyltransferase-isomerase
VTEQTAASVRRAKASGARVIAIGTTVTRALESAAVRGERRIEARAGLTSLRLHEGHALAIVDAVLTGVHVPGESHHELLAAFQPREVLLAACEMAERLGFRSHELGDAMLFFARRPARV